MSCNDTTNYKHCSYTSICLKWFYFSFLYVRSRRIFTFYKNILLYNVELIILYEWAMIYMFHFIYWVSLLHISSQLTNLLNNMCFQVRFMRFFWTIILIFFFFIVCVIGIYTYRTKWCEENTVGAEIYNLTINTRTFECIRIKFKRSNLF